ncbi:MAG: sugar transferase [Terriglobales bacterium]
MQGTTTIPNLRAIRIAPWCRCRRKRAFDVLCACALLLPALPLMAVVAVLIRLSSPGPILFRQRRIGICGSEITVLKFRTMVQSSSAGPGVTASDDPRVTAIGRALRKSKLDELPQLFNVLRGDMSMVGPRPDLPDYLAQLPPRLSELLMMRPGITGWATLRYRHEEELLAAVPPEDITDFYTRVLLPRKARLDLEYGKRATFWSDLSILFRTALAVLS